MKTFKKDKIVELLLDNARQHANLATSDLDFADMACEEIYLAVRLATPKKGYGVNEVINEIYEYTGIMNKSSAVSDYIFAVNNFKWEYKHAHLIK